MRAHLCEYRVREVELLSSHHLADECVPDDGVLCTERRFLQNLKSSVVAFPLAYKFYPRSKDRRSQSLVRDFPQLLLLMRRLTGLSSKPEGLEDASYLTCVSVGILFARTYAEHDELCFGGLHGRFAVTSPSCIVENEQREADGPATQANAVL